MSDFATRLDTCRKNFLPQNPDAYAKCVKEGPKKKTADQILKEYEGELNKSKKEQPAVAREHLKLKKKETNDLKEFKPRVKTALEKRKRALDGTF